MESIENYCYLITPDYINIITDEAKKAQERDDPKKQHFYTLYRCAVTLAGSPKRYQEYIENL